MSASVSQIEIFIALLHRWRLVAITTVLGVGAAILYLLLAPPWYSATLTVVPSESSRDNVSIASKLPIGLDALSSETDVRRIRAVLMSTSVVDAVIDRFNLLEHYDVEYREHARKAVWEHCTSSVDRKSGVVSLSCEDKDPKRAQEMAAYFGEVGNQVFGRISASSAREERRFLETQVVKARQDVDEASQKLREFQEKNKIIDLPEQTKAVISAIASLQGEMLSKQIELSYLNSFSSRTESSVVQLQRQIAIMQSKLAQLEASEVLATKPAVSATGEGSEFFPGAMTVPALRYELERLIRQQKIQETVFFLLMQRFEMAKVDEARDTSAFQILDSPTVPSLRARPKRKRTIAIGAVGGMAFGCALVLLLLAREKRKNRTPSD